MARRQPQPRRPCEHTQTANLSARAITSLSQNRDRSRSPATTTISPLSSPHERQPTDDDNEEESTSEDESDSELPIPKEETYEYAYLLDLLHLQEDTDIDMETDNLMTWKDACLSTNHRAWKRLRTCDKVEHVINTKGRITISEIFEYDMEVGLMTQNTTWHWKDTHRCNNRLYDFFTDNTHHDVTYGIIIRQIAPDLHVNLEVWQNNRTDRKHRTFRFSYAMSGNFIWELDLHLDKQLSVHDHLKEHLSMSQQQKLYIHPCPTV